MYTIVQMYQICPSATNIQFHSITVFCPASEKNGPNGPLVTKHGGHVEYMWAIKIIKTKAISITHF